jgi:hypothetical protein
MRIARHAQLLLAGIAAGVTFAACAPAKRDAAAASPPPPPFSASWQLEPKGAGAGPKPQGAVVIDAAKPFDFLTVFAMAPLGQDIVVRIKTDTGRIGTINTQSALEYSCTGAPLATNPLGFGGLNWYADDGKTAAASLNWRDAYAAAQKFCASRGGGIDSITGAVTVDAALQGPEGARLKTMLGITP